MKKFIASLIFALALGRIVSFSVSAETEDYYTYTITDGNAAITDVAEDISGDITIPSILGGYPVTSIGGLAFRDCSGLASVTIPDSVTSIGEYAFSGCRGLTSVTIQTGVTKVADWTFEGCSSLTSVTIPDSVMSIGNGVFFNCSSLTGVTIPNSVSSIGNSAFNGCSGLTSITIPDSVTSIGGWTFGGCSGLTSINIGGGLSSIGSGVFFDCGNLTSITVNEKNKNFIAPNNVLLDINNARLIQAAPKGVSGAYAIPDSITNIEERAFYDCSRLTAVTIPDGVTSIEEHTFMGCTNLKSVSIAGSMTKIGVCAFYNCSNLTRVTIPRGVTSIGSMAFYQCGNLTSITIPDSVLSIGASAFAGCGLTSIMIPDSVTSIEDGAFSCRNLASITVAAGNKQYSSENNILFNKDKTTLIRVAPKGIGGGYIIPKSVTSISDSAFGACGNLTSVTIPDGVTSIGAGVFSGCGNLTSITIPHSITSIGGSAFAGCGLTSITIPDSVTSIGYLAFFQCSSLKDVYYCGSEEQWNAIGGSSLNRYLTNVTIHYNSAGPAPVPPAVVTITPQNTETEYGFSITPKEVNESCRVYVVSYDAGGKPLDCRVVPLETVGDTTVAVSKSANVRVVKCFVWTAQMQPVSSEKIVVK